MSTQDSWNWKVPTIKGTKWEKDALELAALTQKESHRARVLLNLFCDGRKEGEHPTFLIGALETYADNPIHWAPVDMYASGDGYQIILRPRKMLDNGSFTDRSNAQTFIGNNAINSYEGLTGWDLAVMRTSYDLHCEKCGLRASITSNNLAKVDTFATPLYEAGIREVSLKSFIRFAIQ